MRSMKQLISRLSPLRLAPNSAGLDECVRILQEELPFKIYEFKDESEVNGWIVPKKWEVLEAKIRDINGSIIYDGMGHNLAVIGYSQSFVGRIKATALLYRSF